jgi:hypothetical protein
LEQQPTQKLKADLQADINTKGTKSQSISQANDCDQGILAKEFWLLFIQGDKDAVSQSVEQVFSEAV